MDKKKKAKKPRAKTYEKPLKVNASFDQVLQLCMIDADKKVAEKKEEEKESPKQ